MSRPWATAPSALTSPNAADHEAGVGERAGRLAGEQQDREPEHADRQRARPESATSGARAAGIESRAR